MLTAAPKPLRHLQHARARWHQRKHNMTLMQISVTCDRAFIATDTTTYSSDQGAPGADVYYWPDGEHVAVQKLRPQPHIRGILCGRGSNIVHQFAAERIVYARDFEHAVALLRRTLPAVSAALPAGATFKGHPLQHTVYLVAWSERSCGMALATFDSENGYRGDVKASTPTGTFAVLGPAVLRPAWLSDSEQVNARPAEVSAYLSDEWERDVRDIQTATAYARAAVEQARSADACAPYGGRLLVAELTRDSLQMVDCGDLGLPARRPGAPDIITALVPSLCIAAGAAAVKATATLAATSLTVTGGIALAQDIEITAAGVTKIAGSSIRMTVSGYLTVTFKGSGFASGTKKMLAQVIVLCRDASNAIAFAPQGGLWFREEPTHVELSSVYRIPFEKTVEYDAVSAAGAFHISLQNVYVAFSDQLGTFSAINAISTVVVDCSATFEEVKR